MAIDGKWNIVTIAPNGKIEGTMEFNVDGTTFTGTYAQQNASAEFEDGTIDGNTFKCVMHRDSPMGKLKVNVTGTYDPEAETISGKMKMRLGGARFKGTRSE